MAVSLPASDPRQVCHQSTLVQVKIPINVVQTVLITTVPILLATTMTNIRLRYSVPQVVEIT